MIKLKNYMTEKLSFSLLTIYILSATCSDWSRLKLEARNDDIFKSSPFQLNIFIFGLKKVKFI